MTFQYDFDEQRDRRCSDSIKWRKYDEDILPMWVADMDFLSPEPVIRALTSHLYCDRSSSNGWPGCITGRYNPSRSSLSQAW